MPTSENQPAAQRTTAWKPIEALPSSSVPANGALAAVDALRREWDRRLSAQPDADRLAARQRSLRRLAIETGILERIYDVEWGLTLTLIAEGITREVVERSGGTLDEHTLTTLRSQLGAIEMVRDFVADQRSLSTSFVKELHAALTWTQDSYAATDSLGRAVDVPLPKGQWKLQPNHVIRHDGTRLEYTPPEQVGSEMDRLVTLWLALDATAAHPVLKAAWLHHRIAQIHPFSDGNGRVARALTLLVFEKHRFAPLVVDRWHKGEYLKSLDSANDGDLAPLVRLFARLESDALTRELEPPVEIQGHGVAAEVAHTLAVQLARKMQHVHEEILGKLKSRIAIPAWARMQEWFGRHRATLEEIFRRKALKDVRMATDGAASWDESDRKHWFRKQIYDSAHAADHFAELDSLSAWSSLRIRAGGYQLRFVASLHGVGRVPGIMAVTTFGEIRPFDPSRGAGADDDGPSAAEPILTSRDALRFVHDEDPQLLATRWAELDEFLDAGLTTALAHLLRRT